LYFNCLGHHKISSCNSKHRCHYCRCKHHTSLCSLGQQNSYTDNPPTTPVNTVQQQSNGTTCHSPPVQTHTAHPTSSVQHQTASQLQPATPHQIATQPTVQSTGMHSVTLPPKRNNFCLLKTAAARVKGPNRNTEANILLDEGSQRSFVTKELAYILNLTPYLKELITISPFGTKHPTSCHLDVCRITLLTRSGEELQLSVLVVPHHFRTVPALRFQNSHIFKASSWLILLVQTLSSQFHS